MSALGKLADKFKSLREKDNKHNQDKRNVHEEKPSPDPGSSGYASLASEEDRPDKLQLTDAGQFSYVGVCALSLKELFSSHWHKSFRSQCLKSIIHHLELPQQVETSTFAIMEGHGADNTDPFIKVLEMEPALEEHGLVQVAQDLVTIALKDGCYDARMRVLIQHVAGLLRVEWEVVEEFEETVVESLREEDHTPTEEEEKEKKNKEIKRKVKRYALVGLATVGFGTLIGLTGGLAAPMIAAGAGAIVGGAGAAALGSAAGVAIIGSLFGVAGAGLGGYKMSKRVGALEEFGFETLTPGSQLHVTIAVSGWIKEEDPDFKSAWKSLDNCQEQYVLRFEPKYLIQMGQAMDYIISFAMSAAAQEALKYTVLSGLVAAVAWPVTLLSTASVIDNPWSVCSVRAATAGKQLAEVLLSRLQGKRPVTLIGFSLGARVIFTCLTEMARRTNCEGIVQDAILLGAPVTGNPKHWQLLERVVAGKIVNGYIMGDWFLKFVYRTASVQFTVAGLGPINWNSRQMHNVDLSDVVNGHMDYMKQMDLILKVIGVKVKEVDVLGEYVMVGTEAVEDNGGASAKAEEGVNVAETSEASDKTHVQTADTSLNGAEKRDSVRETTAGVDEQVELGPRTEKLVNDTPSEHPGPSVGIGAADQSIHVKRKQDNLDDGTFTVKSEPVHYKDSSPSEKSDPCNEKDTGLTTRAEWDHVKDLGDNCHSKTELDNASATEGDGQSPVPDLQSSSAASAKREVEDGTKVNVKEAVTNDDANVKTASEGLSLQQTSDS